MSTAHGFNGLFVPLQAFSGATVTVFVIAGLAGSLAIAVAANRTKALTPIVKLCYALGVVCSVVMMEVSLTSAAVSLALAPLSAMTLKA